MNAEQYHALPALSAGGAIILANETPAHYWRSSPFNPRRLPDETSVEFDIGTAAHLAVLEPALFEARTVLIPQDNYRTKQAQELRDHAYSTGRTPLLPKHFNTVQRIKDAIHAHPLARALLTGGQAETVYEWSTDGVACKLRADYLAGEAMVDLKTAESAHPRAFAAAAFRLGYHQRAAWYLDGAQANALPCTRYVFVAVEKDPPHLVALYELDERAVEHGRLLNGKAIEVFKACREANAWPGYARGVATIALPTYADYQIQDRWESGEFKPGATAATLKRAMEMQAPL
jgi:hypothetical protein